MFKAVRDGCEVGPQGVFAGVVVQPGKGLVSRPLIQIESLSGLSCSNLQSWLMVWFFVLGSSFVVKRSCLFADFSAMSFGDDLMVLCGS